MWLWKMSYSKKDCICNPSSCSCENGKYLVSFLDDLAITCDEIIDAEAKLNEEETKTYPTIFNEKNITYVTQIIYILLNFLLITIALLIAVSIYCCLIKYWGKQNHSLPFHFTSKELKELIYW